VRYHSLVLSGGDAALKAACLLWREAAEEARRGESRDARYSNEHLTQQQRAPCRACRLAAAADAA
jgi:hypothetical protein